MSFTEQQITGFHRALNIACGLMALRPTQTDLRAWWDFLREMEPLDDPEAGGPFNVGDIQDVIGEMRRQNKAQQANWSLRPQKILRDPESFRDLILIARSRRRASRPRLHDVRQEQIVGLTTRLIEVHHEEPATTAAEASQKLKEFLDSRRPQQA